MNKGPTTDLSGSRKDDSSQVVLGMSKRCNHLLHINNVPAGEQQTHGP